MTRNTGSNTRVRSLVLIAIGLILLAAPVLMLLLASSSSGGPIMPWDPVVSGIRETIREVWAALTGQPITRDLFP